VRHGVLAQTKHILACKNWSQYFGALGLKFKSKAAIDQLLRFAVYNSIKKRYHRTRMSSSRFAREEVRMPPIAGCLPRGRGVKKPGRKMPGSRQPKRNPEATTPTSKSKPSMKRGPIPVKKPQQPQLMIQNEVNPDPDTTQQPRPTTSTNEPEHPDEKPRSTPEPIAQTPTSKPSITPVPIRQLPQQLAMQSEASSVSTQQQRPSSTTEAAHPGQQPKPNAPTPTPMPVEMIERFRRARLQANLTSIQHQQAAAAVQPSINAPTPTRARVTIPAQIRQQQQQAMQNEVSAASIQQQRSSTMNQTAHPGQKPESNAEQFRASTIRQQQRQAPRRHGSIQQQRRVRPSSMAARPRQRMIVSPNAPTPTRARTQRIPAQIRQQQQRQAMQNQANLASIRQQQALQAAPAQPQQLSMNEIYRQQGIGIYAGSASIPKPNAPMPQPLNMRAPTPTAARLQQTRAPMQPRSMNVRSPHIMAHGPLTQAV